ncbi:hypothetical protein D3C81_1997220 [compost metagenome]
MSLTGFVVVNFPETIILLFTKLDDRDVISADAEAYQSLLATGLNTWLLLNVAAVVPVKEVVDIP